MRFLPQSSGSNERSWWHFVGNCTIDYGGVRNWNFILTVCRILANYDDCAKYNTV